jgi:flagellar export protein FliJ
VKKFKFRLHKVLEYRILVEQWAKEAFLAARLGTFECEGELEEIRFSRRTLLSASVTSIDDRKALEIALQKSDDDEQAKQIALAVLRDEENAALEEWKLKRQELEALKKLRDEAYAQWEQEATRKEQAELDEWANMRRAA